MSPTDDPAQPPARPSRQPRGPAPGDGPRLTDVAKAAGVSPQTVSNVMGGRSGFTEETRQRVVAAAAELNYSPNRAAQRLRTRRSGQLGLHLPAQWLSIREPFAISFLRTATEAAEAAGQQLVVFTTPLDVDSARALVRSGVDGFLLCNVGEDDPRPQMFTDLRVPFALMGRLAPHLPPLSVDVDNAAVMALAVDHVVERGYRDVAYIGYPSEFYTDADRLAGTRTRLAHHGLALPARRTHRADTGNVADVAHHLLSGPDRPDAVICASDSLAVGVHGAASKLGLQLGRDLGLTGVDGLPLPFDLVPGLTTVELPILDASTELVQMLLQRIDGNPLPTSPRILPAQLVVGGTT